MNRRRFFRFLGLGAAAAVVAPKVLLAQKEKTFYERLCDKMHVDAETTQFPGPGIYKYVHISIGQISVGDKVYYADTCLDPLATKAPRKFVGYDNCGFAFYEIDRGHGFIQIPDWDGDARNYPSDSLIIKVNDSDVFIKPFRG